MAVSDQMRAASGLDERAMYRYTTLHDHTEPVTAREPALELVLVEIQLSQTAGERSRVSRKQHIVRGVYRNQCGQRALEVRAKNDVLVHGWK